MVFLIGIKYGESNELNSKVQSKLSKLLKDELQGGNRLKKFEYISKTHKSKENTSPNNSTWASSISNSTLQYLQQTTSLIRKQQKIHSQASHLTTHIKSLSSE
jgi:hypothetical protein